MRYPNLVVALLLTLASTYAVSAEPVCCLTSNFDMVPGTNPYNVEINEFSFRDEITSCSENELLMPGPCSDVDLCDHCESEWRILFRDMRLRNGGMKRAYYCLNIDGLSTLGDEDRESAYYTISTYLFQTVIPVTELEQNALQCRVVPVAVATFKELLSDGPSLDGKEYCVKCAKPEPYSGDLPQSCQCNDNTAATCFGRGKLEEIRTRGNINYIVCHVPPPGDKGKVQTQQLGNEASVLAHLSKHPYDLRQPCCVCDEGYNPFTYCEEPLYARKKKNEK
jgi:hypothetical protein